MRRSNILLGLLDQRGHVFCSVGDLSQLTWNLCHHIVRLCGGMRFLVDHFPYQH